MVSVVRECKRQKEFSCGGTGHLGALRQIAEYAHAAAHALVPKLVLAGPLGVARWPH